MSASCWAGYSSSPRPVAQASNASYRLSASGASGRRSARPVTRGSLEVRLHLGDGLLGGGVRVLARTAQGVAAAQEVPQLVEVLLGLAQPAAVVLAERVALAAQAVLLGDELVDVGEDLLAVHAGSRPGRARGPEARPHGCQGSAGPAGPDVDLSGAAMTCIDSGRLRLEREG